MTRYVSFLRGINVGGNKIIKMDDLKRYFEELKLNDVSTFIQSGNVLFVSSGKDINRLNNSIEKGLEEKLGYRVEVFTRTFEDVNKIIKKVPFSNVKLDKINKIYISFLQAPPAESDILHIEKLSYEGEEFVVSEKEAYILLKKDKIKEKALFTNNFLEKKLRVSATTRDLNTLLKIAEL